VEKRQRMNILVSTTVQHNPGDEIILQGVKNVLNKVFITERINYAYYNRNPDLQILPLRAAREELVGNYDNEVRGNYDLVVLAGSPEFSGDPLKKLFEKVLEKDLPVLALGIGTTFPNHQLTKLDVEVLSRRNTKIITRSKDAKEVLDKHGIKSEARICPALFSATVRGIKAGGTGCIVQAPGMREWHAVKPRYLSGLKETDEKIFFHVNEYLYFKQSGIFVNTARDAQAVIGCYSKIFSTRLHGAIAALSQGIPSVVIGEGDHRIETAAEMFGDFLPVARDFSHAETIVLKSSEEIDELKWRCYDSYVARVGELLEDLSL
jgi:hypothetical protein